MHRVSKCWVVKNKGKSRWDKVQRKPQLWKSQEDMTESWHESGMYSGSWHNMHLHVATSGQCQLSAHVTCLKLSVPMQQYCLDSKPQVSRSLHLFFARITTVLLCPPFFIGSRDPKLSPYICVTNALLAGPPP